jgi:hypothetical protein
MYDWYYSVEDLEWYQTAFMSYGDRACLMNEFTVPMGDMTDCDYYFADYDDTWEIN